MPAPTEAHVSGSWPTVVGGWILSMWQWFTGDASGMAVMIGIGTIVLTSIKIAQEIQAWKARDEEKQVLRKLWERVSKKTRPGSL